MIRAWARVAPVAAIGSLVGLFAVLPPAFAAQTYVVTVSNSEVLEGSGSGVTTAHVTVTLPAPTPVDLSFAYHTESMSATAGSDFYHADSTVVIPAGQASGNIPVSVLRDTSDEFAEQLKVVVDSGPGLAAVRTVGEGIVTIIDDDVTGHWLKRSGAGLTYDRMPYFAIGINDPGATSQWWGSYGQAWSNYNAGQPSDPEGFAAYGRGALVRIWAFQGMSVDKDHGNVVNWEAIDRVFRAAEKYGVLLSVVPDNHWATWDHGTRDRAFYEGGGFRSWTGLRGMTHLQWISALHQRYGSSPAFGMWCVANEPEQYGVKEYLRESYQHIQSIDPGRVVASSVIGGNQTGLAGSDYHWVHRDDEGATVTVPTYHDYNAPGDRRPWTGQLNVAQGLGKPFMVDEVDGNYWDLVERARALKDAGGDGFIVWGRPNPSQWQALREVAGPLH